MAGEKLVVANIACSDPRDTLGAMRMALVTRFGADQVIPCDEFGPIGVILGGATEHRRLALHERLAFAVNHLGVSVISLAAHEECRARPMDEPEAWAKLPEAVEEIKKHLLANGIDVDKIRFVIFWQRKNIPDPYAATHWQNVLVADSAMVTV